MTHWDIHLAFRDRAEPLVVLLDDQRALAPQERGLTRAVLLELAAEYGCKDAGAALDTLGGMTRQERRRLLDTARAAEGLESTASTEAREQVAAATQASVARAAARSPWQTCGADGCVATPLGPVGQAVPSPYRRFWCEAHRHLAAEGDLARAGPRLAYGPSGDVIDLDEVEAERRQAEAEQRDRDAKRAALAEQHAHAAAERAAERKAKLAALRAEHPAGVFPA